jgi:hypothetical protein
MTPSKAGLRRPRRTVEARSAREREREQNLEARSAREQNRE